MSLTGELAEWKLKIAEIARDQGLDFYDTIFEMVDTREMCALAAYGGFPVRYPHWKFGEQFEELNKSHQYGLSKIYEMVINNDPCYAYLLDVNKMVDHKTVMAHVYAHCDFFKNNFTFANTDRKMLNSMANHAKRIRRYMDRMGQNYVENFIDICLSIDNLIDYSGIHLPKEPVRGVKSFNPDKFVLPNNKDYLEDFINPKDVIEKQKQKYFEQIRGKKKFPQNPQRDIMKFLIDYAPLPDWQLNVLDMLHQEALYFAPQAQTKIMNEGWATYWHSKMMTQHILDASEILEFADHHAGTVFMPPGNINPYKIGVELFRDIEDRWNKGRHGKDFDECTDMIERECWDTEDMKGLEKIFQVRSIYNDVNFIDSFFNQDFCDKHQIYHYQQDPQTGQVYVFRDHRIIKNRLLFSLINAGQPFIEIVDANHENKGELYLKHIDHIGVPLDHQWAVGAMASLFKLWTRPVNIETFNSENEIVKRFDGRDYEEIVLRKREVEEEGSQGL